MQHDPRRGSPRIDVAAMCWEVVAERETNALVVDLSIEGARVERPFIGGRIQREVPLQIEVPGIDEVMWARGDVVFDHVVQAPKWGNGGPFGLLRRTGYRIAIAASRDLRLLRDYVYEMHRAIRVDEPELAFATCYARG